MKHALTHFSLILTFIFAATVQPVLADSKNTAETYKQLNLFGDVFERVREQYVDEVTDKDLIEHAVNGMLTSLDPHSSYLNDDDYSDMRIQTKGEFGGLGIEVTMESGLVKVVSPIDDTPAFRAGVEAGDFITHIDEEPVLGLTLSEAVDKMRGKVGTNIDITIRREGEVKPIEITIKRDTIKIQAVRQKIYDDVGYLRITTFNQNTETHLKKAVAEIEKELGGKLKGYVIDLRNNPGGLLDQAIAVADAFLDKGEIVSTRGRNSEDTRRDNAHRGDITANKPLVVMINGGSASASEIVAGALQDHRRAVVMGTKSFGKGSVQTIIPIPGHGAMRLTTARYYTPSGRSIQAKGIEPDIIVEPARLEKLENLGVSEADLRGALDNKVKKKVKKDDKEASDEAPDEGAENENKDAVEDYQLLRAIDLLRGVSLYQSGTIDNVVQVSDDEDSDESDTDSEEDEEKTN